MKFNDDLALLLIDKVIIAGIAFVLWHLYTKRKAKEESLQRKLEKLEEEKRVLKNERRRTELNEKISYLNDRLERFFWPLHLCFKKDDAVWKRVPALYGEGDSLPTETGTIIEEEFLIPNHENAVKIIESNFHLVSDDDKFIELMIKYIRHVAVFRALRMSKQQLNPIDVDEEFPQDFVASLESEMEKCRKELARLKKRRFETSSMGLA